MFFRLSSLTVVLLIVGAVVAAIGVGVVLGRRVRTRASTYKEPLAIVQPALLGVVGLLLAFGLTLAVGRHEARRAAVVQDANAMGTTFLRAQTLVEPVRTQSLVLLRQYVDTSLRLSSAVPGSVDEEAAVADGAELHRALWSLAGDALASAPTDSAPRLYVESLNEMIDVQTVRVAAVNNRVPPTVLVLELVGATAALGLLACYLAVQGRGVPGLMLAATLFTSLLLVTIDLDRPTRGLLQVPTAPLTALQAMMAAPPAADGLG
jgi:hypothetical protein